MSSDGISNQVISAIVEEIDRLCKSHGYDQNITSREDKNIKDTKYGLFCLLKNLIQSIVIQALFPIHAPQLVGLRFIFTSSVDREFVRPTGYSGGSTHGGGNAQWVSPYIPQNAFEKILAHFEGYLLEEFQPTYKVSSAAMR